MHITARVLRTAQLFVPKYIPPTNEDIARFNDHLRQHHRIAVITGAGVSTESGIPDYRSEEVGRFATSKRKPVQYQEFVKSADVRKRFWARNFAGWTSFKQFQPNINHHILAEWEKHGIVSGVITQNVDNLHQKAGSKNVIELHGSNYRVWCMNCTSLHCREHVQEIIATMNKRLNIETLQLAPDGDVDIEEELYQHFMEPACPKCEATALRPHVVFFGDNVPKQIVLDSIDIVDGSDALLILGSTLQTYSSFRFIKQANEQRKPVYIINIGSTRADNLCDMKISSKCSHVLESIDLTL